MRTRINACLVSLFLIFSPSLFAHEQQSSTATTTASTNTTISTTAEAFSKMLSTFPQTVLSTINSVVLNSTNATSVGEQKDSLLKKDNVALQMGLFETSRVGIGVKYWLTELTALRVGGNTSLNAGISSNAGFRTSGNNSFANTSVRLPNISSNLSFDIGLFANIEKHLFATRILSPFIGFGMGINIASRNSLGFGTATGGNSSGNSSSQSVGSETQVYVSAGLNAGVEYFVLPNISISALASLYGNISGTFNGSSNSSQSSNSQSTDRFYSVEISPSLYVGIGAGFSSSITLSVYFGRNALGDIVNAFKSGTMFQW